jgi:cytoskeletal protein RodZ
MVHSLPDVTISATATALSATSVKANWVQVQGQALSGAARVGDSLISTTRGALMASTGDSQFFPPSGNSNAYDLSTIYIIGTASDKAAVVYNVT